mgnify:CR=1 FL=1
MRMRKKPNLIPRMERCAAYQVKDPELWRGRWRERLAPGCELRLELGCGKGRFTCETAQREPEVLFVAVERVPDAMVMAMERAQAMELQNVLFIDADVARLADYFAPGEVERIYLNFCDPWPRKKNAKRRLTHRNFLARYSRVLTPGGQIHLKTDNPQLFQFSLEEFQALDFPVRAVTWNLHEHGPVGIMTDYEEKFYRSGLPIHRCEATAHPIEATEVAYEKSEERENSVEERGED